MKAACSRVALSPGRRDERSLSLIELDDGCVQPQISSLRSGNERYYNFLAAC